MKYPIRQTWRLLLPAAVLSLVPASQVTAHRSGCHRWHSCPSDRGTYVCGDLGHCSGCGDNQYCEAGHPRRTGATAEKGHDTATSRPGVPSEDAWTCPASHPIKGNFTTSSGERCIYHVRGGRFYDKTKPERCYATEEEARRDGSRKSKR